MQPIRAKHLRIMLFEGTAEQVRMTIDQWCEQNSDRCEVVDVHYNYQGPEYDGNTQVTIYGTHGVLLAYRMTEEPDVKAE